MKFKIGDKVTAEHLPNKVFTIESIDDKYYHCGKAGGYPIVIPIDKEWQFGLYKPKRVSWLGKFFKKKKKNNTMEQDLEDHLKIHIIFIVLRFSQHLVSNS